MSSTTLTHASPQRGTRTETCVACGDAELEPFLDLGQVPVATTSLYRTREGAQAAPMGRMILHACPNCGLVRNVAFDADAVAYDTEYENSQHFSPTFQRYAEQLADRLSEAHGLRDATIADIGCGKGEFLALLCERAEAHGIGFDPTYDGEVDGLSQRIEIRREFYPGSGGELDVQLVSCRHVLEHLQSPDELLLTLRRSLTGPVPVYFEVPNAEYVFSRSGMWDLIYQHVSYFDARSFCSLFERYDFGVTRLARSFEGQFLSLDAVPGAASLDVPRRQTVDLTDFGRTFEDANRKWEGFAAANGDRLVVLWGAGAKGVSFLNLTAVGPIVDVVVDVNPRKRATFVPGTGQPIVAPAELRELQPETVIVANPVYEREIRVALSELDLSPEVVCL